MPKFFPNPSLIQCFAFPLPLHALLALVPLQEAGQNADGRLQQVTLAAQDPAPSGPPRTGDALSPPEGDTEAGARALAQTQKQPKHNLAGGGGRLLPASDPGLAPGCWPRLSHGARDGICPKERCWEGDVRHMLSSVPVSC